MNDIESMSDYMDRIARQHNGDPDAAFKSVRQDFIKAGPQQRAQWLEGWWQSLSLEDRPTHEHAEYLTMQRELQSIDAVLKSAGR